MGFFNFIESFFFISLAITFVLIMMIIYHFKERINVIEKKNETTIEILNNLAKELTGLRGFVLQIHSAQRQSDSFMPPMSSVPSFFCMNSSDMGIPQKNNITIALEDHDDDEDAIQIEHLNIGEDLSSSIMENESDSEDEEESLGCSESDEDSGSEDEDEGDEAVSEIQIEKIVVADEEPEPVPVPLSEPEFEFEVESETILLPIDDISKNVSPPVEDYNKLTTSQLKIIVSSLPDKIHVGSVNKLKRPELLKLLEAHS